MKCLNVRQESIKILEENTGETLLHCWWECELVQPLWKTVWRFLKQLKIDLPYDPAIAAGDLPQRFRCNETPGHLHPDVYSSNVHNSQTMEGASVSIER